MATFAIMAGIAIASSFVMSKMAPKPKQQAIDKGRVDDIRFQYSEYGGTIPIGFGRFRMAGNIYWSDSVHEHITTEPGHSGGKGGGGNTTSTPPTRNFSYTTNLGISFCLGPAAYGIRKVWDGPDLIVNRDGSTGFGDIGTIYIEAERPQNTLTGGARSNDTAASGGRVVTMPTSGARVMFPSAVPFPLRSTVGPGEIIDSTWLTIQYKCSSNTNVGIWVNGVLNQTVALTSSPSAFGTLADIALGSCDTGASIELRGGGNSLVIDRIMVTHDAIVIFDDDPRRTGMINPLATYPVDQDNPLPYYNDFAATSGGGVTSTTSNAGAGAVFRFYDGTTDGQQDPYEVLRDGAQFTPAYNKIVRMFIENYTIPGGSMRQWTVEIDEGTTDLADIMVKLYGMANFPSGKLNMTQLSGITVPGLIINTRQPLSEVLSSLATFFAFDLVDVDGKIMAVKRGQAPVATIYEKDIGVFPFGSQRPVSAVKDTRTDILDLPDEVTIGYVDMENNFTNNTQPAARQIEQGSVDPVNINFPIVCDAAVAQQVGLQWLYAKQLERNTLEFTLGPKYAWLAPGDVVQLVMDDGTTYQPRLVSVQLGVLGLVQCKGFPEKASIYLQMMIGNRGTGFNLNTLVAPANTKLVVFETPNMRLEDLGLGYWVAACGRGRGQWIGCDVYQAEVSTGTYNRFTTISEPAIIGQATTVLANDPGGAFDSTSTVRIQLFSGSLSSATQAHLLANPQLNLAWFQGELLQFTTATPVTPTGSYVAAYDVSGFYRKRFGTPGTGHQSGDTFVLMTSAVKHRNAEVTQIGVTGNYKGVSLGGQVLANAQQVNFTFTGISYLSPPINPAYSFNGSVMTYTWDAPTTFPERITGYEVWKSTNTADPTNRLATVGTGDRRGSSWSENLLSYVQSGFARYVRAIDGFGNASIFTQIVFSSVAGATLRVFDTTLPPHFGRSGLGLVAGTYKSGAGDWFNNTTIYLDRGQGYNPVGATHLQPVAGVTATPYLSSSGTTVRVTFETGHTPNNDWYLIGKEYVKVTSWSLVSGTTYDGTVSAANRGLYFTEIFKSTHTASENVIRVAESMFVPLDFSDIGQTINLKAVPLGKQLGDVSAVTVVPTGESVKGPSPINAVGNRVLDDWQFGFDGRSRSQDEPAEYLCDVVNVGTGAFVRQIPVQANLRQAGMLIDPSGSGAFIGVSTKHSIGGGGVGFEGHARSTQKLEGLIYYIEAKYEDTMSSENGRMCFIDIDDMALVVPFGMRALVHIPKNVIGGTVANNQLTKTAATGWNTTSGFTSHRPLIGDFRLSFYKDTTGGSGGAHDGQQIGLSVNATPLTLDAAGGSAVTHYGIQPYNNGATVRFHEAGSSADQAVTWNSSSLFIIERIGSTIKYYHGGTLLRILTSQTTAPLYVYCNLYYNGMTSDWVNATAPFEIYTEWTGGTYWVYVYENGLSPGSWNYPDTDPVPVSHLKVVGSEVLYLKDGVIKYKSKRAPDAPYYAYFYCLNGAQYNNIWLGVGDRACSSIYAERQQEGDFNGVAQTQVRLQMYQRMNYPNVPKGQILDVTFP